MLTDEQLMQSFALGDDRAAFSELYRRCAPMVQRVARRYAVGGGDAEDVVQQAFLQLHVSRDRYRVGAPLRPWLKTIAVNLCREHGRKRLRRQETDHEIDRLGAAGADSKYADTRETKQPAMLALEGLSASTRRIFREHFLEDRPLVEIARRMGENPNTVRVRLHRGCRQLRAELAS